MNTNGVPADFFAMTKAVDLAINLLFEIISRESGGEIDRTLVFEAILDLTDEDPFIKYACEYRQSGYIASLRMGLLFKDSIARSTFLANEVDRLVSDQRQILYELSTGKHLARNQRAEDPKQGASAIPPKTANDFGTETPDLDVKSGDWIKADKKNEKKLGLSVMTLKAYRMPTNGGWVSPCKMHGVDNGGRKWRRKGTTRSHVYYLVSSIAKSGD